ncbi:MAG: ABC transporter substrate-binding protein [Parvibaculum sp.]|nr:ABC transporter substrate-binding protein [Parvibaculum sp.]
MRTLALILLTLMAGLARAEAAPQRIVSINLCTDILALDLARPGTLKSVFRVAADAGDSPVVDKARGLPLNNATAEEILSFKPDLVLAHAFSSPFTLSLLRQAKIPVVQVKDAESFADVRANVRVIAAALGQEAKGEAMIARFDASLAASARPMTAHAPRAVIYQDLGGAAAANTILGAMLIHTGFENVVQASSSGGFVNLTIEDLINTRPDFVAVGIYRPLEPSLAHEVLTHPALKAYIAAHARSTDLPAKLWTCGSPYVAEIATRLATARDGFDEKATQ